MAVIFQTNKKTGITYAYQNEPYWDKEKHQSRAKRTLIGKVDPVQVKSSQHVRTKRNRPRRHRKLSQGRSR